MTLSMGATLYIAKYKSIYKMVIKEGKWRENDRILIQATNKLKAVWKIINDEVGRSSTITHDITLDIQSNEIGDMNKIVDLFNVYFCETPVKLLKSNKLNNISPSDKHRVYIKGCNKSIFFQPNYWKWCSKSGKESQKQILHREWWHSGLHTKTMHRVPKETVNGYI